MRLIIRVRDDEYTVKPIADILYRGHLLLADTLFYERIDVGQKSHE